MTLNELITIVTSEIKLFLETSLIITSYFYRKSLSVSFEKFAHSVIEIITKLIFQSNSSALFKFYLDLYNT